MLGLTFACQLLTTKFDKSSVGSEDRTTADLEKAGGYRNRVQIGRQPNRLWCISAETESD